MSELVSIQSLIVGHTKGITPKYVADSDVIVLNQKCIRNNGIDFSLSQFHDPSKCFSDAKAVKIGDILINSTGQGTAGRCAFVKKLPAGKKVIVDSHILIIRISGFYTAGCVEYSLFSIEKMLQTFMDGSTGQGEFDKQRLFNIYTALPDQTKRCAVYDFLNNLDAKIECNNRINAELEAMAKTLYDYWFVQFDFPDHNGKPYKSSGGKMVYNPTLKREIPAGWSDSNILAVADLLGGGTPSKKKPEFWNGNIPFFTPSDADGTIFKFATEDYITEEGLKKSSTKLFEEKTVFITARGSVGKLVLAGIKMAMNQSCYALRAKTGISYTFLFFLVKELIHHLEVKSSGSVFDSIVSNDIEFTNLAIPDSALVEKFAAVAEPAFERIANNTRENQQLTQLRDWLLPMLMNGQVTVV
jgi:type I restriction enzyme S subunit